MRGCPYDNAVAEATFKIIKTEFVKGNHIDSLEELTREFHDYFILFFRKVLPIFKRDIK
jgi:putative transposase